MSFTLTDNTAQSRSRKPAHSHPRSNFHVTAQSLPRVPPGGSPAKDVPLARKEDTRQRCLQSRTAGRAHSRLATEARNVLIGPMPVKQFLNEFLPPVRDDNTMPDSIGAFDDVPAEPKTKHDISTPLIWSINEGGRCPNVEFVDTSVTINASGPGVYQPDITGYDLKDKAHLVTADSERVESQMVKSDAEKSVTTMKGRLVGTEKGEPKEIDVVGHVKGTVTVDNERKKKPLRYHANLGLADLFFAVRTKYDMFIDEHGHSGKDKKGRHFIEWENYDQGSKIRDAGKKIFGRMVAYAAEACARQHRVFYFSVLVVGTRARFFRWDRAGVIVTRAFDYHKQPELLCEFLWRFGHANATQRGFDPTVTVASSEERDLFKEIISEEVEFQLNIGTDDAARLRKALNLHHEEGKVSKMHAYNKISSRWEEYLVSVPVNSPGSVTGRCTRAYWAVKVIKDSSDRTKGMAAFLKDSWRISAPNIGDEGSIYENMGGKVEKIPNILAYGDVFGDCDYLNDDISDAQCRTLPKEGGNEQINISRAYQSTRTQEFVCADWVCSCLNRDHHKKRIVKHIHYRLTLDEVGYSLRHFVSSRELFGAVRDAFEALDSAYRRCKRLHRDVSVDNIILVRSRRMKRREGRLVDWEFSSIADKHGRAKDYLRSGTWAFMPAGALHRRRESFRHSVENDLESLFYVSMYCSLLWLPHREYEELGDWIYNFFDQVSVFQGRDTGGGEKNSHIYDSELFTSTFAFDNEYIQAWFADVYEDLASSAENLKREGFTSRWTNATFRRHIDDASRGLEGLDWEESDRVEHWVDDYHVERADIYYDPNARMTPSDVDTSDALALGSEAVLRQGHRGRKRSLEEGGHGRAVANGCDGSERAGKRSRSGPANNVIVAGADESIEGVGIGPITTLLDLRLSGQKYPPHGDDFTFNVPVHSDELGGDGLLFRNTGQLGSASMQD